MKKILHSLENFTQLKLSWYSKSIKTSYLIPKYDISSTGNFSTPNVALFRTNSTVTFVALIQTISKSNIRSNSNKLRTIPFSKYDEYSTFSKKKFLEMPCGKNLKLHLRAILKADIPGLFSF